MRKPRLFLRSRLNTVFVIWRHFGFVRVAWFVLGLLVRYERLYRLRVDLTGWRPPAAAAPDVTVLRGSLDMLERFRAAHPKGSLPFEFYLDLTHWARWFYVALIGREIASIAWIFIRGERTHIPLAEGEVEIAHVHTLRAYRNRGLFKALSLHMLESLKTAGYRVAYAHVEVTNHASLRAHEAIGYERAALIHLFRLFGYPLVILRPLKAPASPHLKAAATR